MSEILTLYSLILLKTSYVSVNYKAKVLFLLVYYRSLSHFLFNLFDMSAHFSSNELEYNKRTQIGKIDIGAYLGEA